MNRRFRKLLRDERGQAMVEYSTITFAILLMLGGTAFAMPMTAFGQKVSLAQALYASLQTYVDSYYYSLHLLVP
ncbi:MAG: hypothetical protein JST54_15695 [Deltaproteobacteria bacterium]|nr:hypothetical protein [Deltaproteobacteria bacterium]